PLWLHTYERTAGGPAHHGHVPAPCRIVPSTVIAAPTDAADIFALDAASGERLWTTLRPAGARILAVERRRVLLGGPRLLAIALHTGQIDRDWGREVADEAGQGVAAGDLIFLPPLLEIV